jgi:hypothetical protein
MTMVEFLPLVAGLCFVGFSVTLALGRGPKAGWALPAALSVLFAGWSLLAILREGPFGFWADLTASLWGVQIWFDLLLAASAALAFMLPEARRQGMRTLPWVAFVILTGSVGLMAFLSRIMFLRSRT